MALGNHKRNYQKRPVLKLGCWNVRTMTIGLSASLQDIKDSRKTAVINDELKKLNVDIATLQETRLADWYPKGEELHILMAGEELQRAQRAWSRICNEEQLA